MKPITLNNNNNNNNNNNKQTFQNAKLTLKSRTGARGGSKYMLITKQKSLQQLSEVQQ